MDKAPKLYTIRIDREEDDDGILDWRRVKKNGDKGIETCIIPDVNIIYAVRDVLLRRTNLNDSGLNAFRDLLNSSHASLAPGIAIREIPPALRTECQYMFDTFVYELCDAKDHPKATWPIEYEKSQSLKPLHEEALVSENPVALIPYYYITKIHHLALECVDWARIDIFKRFIDEVISDIDMLSATEIEVATYCFCDDGERSRRGVGYSNEAKTKIADVRRNFLGRTKDNKTFDGRMRVISNAVRDLTYVYTCRVMNEQKFFGVPQELWFSTFDGKLANLFKNFFFLSVDGVASHAPHLANLPGFRDAIKGRFAFRSAPEGASDFAYWMSVDEVLSRTFSSRFDKHLQKTPDNFLEILNERSRLNVLKIQNKY